MSAPQQTVFVVDDDASYLTGMRRLLSGAGYAVECYASATEFLAQRSKQAAGCVVTDLHMPDMDGLELQATLAKSNDPLPFIFVSGRGDTPATVEAMREGAEDFLDKTAPKEKLLVAIEHALKRDALERARRMQHHDLLARFELLTPRENEVLAGVLRGCLNKQIAAEMGIDERSVKRHRSNLTRKLDVSSVAELVQLAVKARK